MDALNVEGACVMGERVMEPLQGDLDGGVRRLRTIDRRGKVEGVHATIDTGVVDFLFVCDQDDLGEPSPLLSASMPLDARFEVEGAVP